MLEAGAESLPAHAPRPIATKTTSSAHPSVRLIRPSRSAQPAFTALVVLHLAIGLARAHLGEAQVELLDVGVVAQAGGGALQHDAAVFHHVAVVGDGQR